jgi:hypothetical protein
MAGKSGDAAGGRWLILFYQVPPKPPYLRVKISRRLGKVGALAVKPTVYVLPKSEGALEDFQWVARELAKEGGDATICQARLVEGLQDDSVERLFNDARSAAYREIQREARRTRGTEPQRQTAQLHLRRCLSDLVEIDFFGAPGRREAEAAVARLYQPPPSMSEGPVPRPVLKAADYRGRTWVTRTGIHVDRIACSWLIRRFIDPRARLKFVAAKGYAPEKGELRFDMFDGEFTHEGEDCSFEVLLNRFGIADAALRRLAMIVHDIDLRDAKFRREEAPGIERLIAGICLAHPKDDDRLRRGKDLFDDLYEYYHRKGNQ